MKAIILARVSTEEQKEAGNSLPAQIERLKNYCDRKGYELLEVFSFDESAYKAKRDEFDRIIDFVNEQKEPIVICFDKVDRLSRSIFDKRVSYLYEKALAGAIELHFVSDGQVISPNISASEKFQFGITLGLAKYYSDAISDNVRRAFEQKRRNGEWIGKPRIGYMNVRDENGRKDIVVDPSKAHLIIQAFELYATGTYSTRTLRTRMATEGLLASTGKPLSASLIGYILQDPFYFGEAVHAGNRYPHKYPPLISRELYDQVQAVRLGWKKKPFQYAAKDFALRGLIQCANCGCTFSPETKKGKYTYYSCTNYRKHCERIYIPEKDLLAPIREKLRLLSDIPQDVIDQVTAGIRSATESKSVYHAQAIKSIRAEYDALQIKLDRLVDLLTDGSITPDIYDRKLHQLKERQRALELQLEEHTNADEGFLTTAGTVLSLAKEALAIFDSSEPAEKRVLLNYLLQNPVVTGKKLDFTLRSPFDSVLELSRQPALLRR